jgi:cysteinyl-tRNA synthetase
VLRLAMLMTHYREPIDFSVRKLEEARSILDRWYSLVDAYGWPTSSFVPNEFLEVISDDINFSGGRAWLEQQAKSITGVSFGTTNMTAGSTGLPAFVGAAKLMGLLNRADDWKTWASKIGEGAFDNEILQSLVGLTVSEIDDRKNRRLAFIREKNWAEADKIRDELAEQGIQLKDGKDPATGERVTTWEVKR